MIGASVIFGDVPVQKLTGKKDFRIQDNKTFLACSLSLSFGVMVNSILRLDHYLGSTSCMKCLHHDLDIYGLI